MAHNELKYDDAAFLPIITAMGAGAGNDSRSCLMQSVEHRGGHYTDGRVAAQFWHVIHIHAESAGAPGETEEGDPECSEVSPQLGCLRGDVEYDFDGTLAHIGMVPQVPIELEFPVMGWHWFGPPAPLPPDRELYTDPNSNQTIISRMLHQSIRPWVKIPAPYTPPCEQLDIAPPTAFPGLPAGTVAASGVNNVGAFTNLYQFGLGNDVGAYLVIPLPPKCPAPLGITLVVQFITPAGNFLGTVKTRLDICVIAKGGNAAPGAVSYSIPKTIDATTDPGALVEGREVYFIPGSVLAAAPNGKIAAVFYRDKTDAQLDLFNAIGAWWVFGPEFAR